MVTTSWQQPNRLFLLLLETEQKKNCCFPLHSTNNNTLIQNGRKVVNAAPNIYDSRWFEQATSTWFKNYA